MSQRRSSRVFRDTRNTIFAFYCTKENQGLIAQVQGTGDPRPFWDSVFITIVGKPPSRALDTQLTVWPGMTDPKWDELIDGEAGILEAKHRVERILGRLHTQRVEYAETY